MPGRLTVVCLSAARWRASPRCFGGSNVSNGQALSTNEAGVQYTLARQARITLLARDLSIGGVRQLTLYRAQLDYTF